MPTYDKHLRQAAHNEELMKRTVGLGGHGEFSDWAVTIAFYTAIHSVEAALATAKPKMRNGNVVEHCLDHSLRNIVIKLVFGVNMHIPYSALYKYSKMAKYDCYEPKTYIRANAERCLEVVKRECQKFYPD